MNDHFDMNELFQHLVNSEHSSVQSLFTASSSVFDAYARSLLTPVSKATPHRPFSEDNRHQRTFTFSFEYYTVIGEERQPMHWQSHDKRLSASSSHLPLTRCSSVVSLALLGDPIKKVRNTSRRKNVKVRQGLVYDPFSPWLVLNIQAYPDWIGTADAHDSSKHYVNGPEAFLATVLMEFRDARKRYEEIYKQITKMITPPPDFIFDEDQRDKRLFEDANFTYTRGYFWAHQTLGSINDSIKAMIDAYEDTFTDEVWEGKHKSIWPLLDEALPRNDHFRRKLYLLRKEFEREVKHLEAQIKENNDRRLEIRDLRDQLFSGTSVLESRKSVELSEITILQGHNVKLLTLINIFFMVGSRTIRVSQLERERERERWLADMQTASHVCDKRFWNDKHANGTQLLGVWDSSGHRLCAILPPDRLAQHDEGLRILESKMQRGYEVLPVVLSFYVGTDTKVDSTEERPITRRRGRKVTPFILSSTKLFLGRSPSAAAVADEHEYGKG